MSKPGLCVRWWPPVSLVHSLPCMLAFALALASLLLLGGCSTMRKWNVRRPGSNVFITPMRCEQEQGRLRLAVKDNIDVEGVVTSGGSKHLAATRAPAEKDAPCL